VDGEAVRSRQAAKAAKEHWSAICQAPDNIKKTLATWRLGGLLSGLGSSGRRLTSMTVH
jgi:hypothetical protein